MSKQKFYVVAHNPNTVEEAEAFLKAGANGLGPDISFENGVYYVSHGGPGSNPLDAEFSLENYLSGLKRLMETGNYNLALIIFDVKDPIFDINEFVNFVQQNFLNHIACKGVSVLISTADIKDIAFLNNYNQAFSNIGIAVDEHSAPVEVLESFRDSRQRNIAYGNGITSILPKLGLFNSISEAKQLQKNADSFKLVFVWVLKSERSMKKYLEIETDAFIVDLEEVPQALGILQQEPFCNQFELAMQGYNPWSPII